ncbi:hypothetical protein [Jatrophihabitans fulvus]
MSSPLARIPVVKRRQLAATLALFATLFVAVGAVALTGATTVVLKVFVGIAFAVAVFLAFLAWGVANSIRIDTAATDEARLDDAIERAVLARGESMCGPGCGHDHDPSEMTITDAPCDQDGHGVACTHSCETCTLSALRRPTERSTERPSPAPRRPSPTPR